MSKLISTAAGLSLAVSITACGPSEQQKANEAGAACAVVQETNAFQSSERVRQFNSARKALEMEPYTSGDEVIVKAVKMELCKELVLDGDGSVVATVRRQIEKEEAEAEAERLDQERVKREIRQQLKEEQERKARELMEKAAGLRQEAIDKLGELVISNADLIAQNGSIPRDLRLALEAPCVLDTEQWFSVSLNVTFSNGEKTYYAAYSGKNDFRSGKPKCELSLTAYGRQEASTSLRPFLRGENNIVEITAYDFGTLTGTGEFEGVRGSDIKRLGLETAVPIKVQ